MSLHLSVVEIERLVWKQGAPGAQEAALAHVSSCLDCALHLALFLDLGPRPKELEEQPLRLPDRRAMAQWGGAELSQTAWALGQAMAEMVRGTGSALAAAHWGELAASLLGEQRRFAEACRLLGDVERLYREAGDLHLAGRALVKLGLYTQDSFGPENALPILCDAVALLDGERDPPLLAKAHLGILLAMVDCGQYRPAAELLLASGLRQALADDPLGLAELRWAEGRVWRGLGNLPRAARALGEARQGLADGGRAYEAAVAGLDLAAVALRRGKRTQGAALLAEALATFERLDVACEGRATVALLAEAAHRGTASPLAVERISRFLVRLDRHPGSCPAPPPS